MIEDFEPLNSVVRSRQFFSGYAKCVKNSVIFFRDTQTVMDDFQQIFRYRLGLWFWVRLSVMLESG